MIDRKPDGVIIPIVTAGMFMLAGAVTGVLVHEAGHYTACQYLGYESTGITITPNASYHTCRYEGNAIGIEIWVVQAAGGGIAAAAFGSVRATLACKAFSSVTGLRDYARLFSSTGFTTQAINFVTESFFNMWYDETSRIVGFAAGLALAILLERRMLEDKRRFN